ncbi:MAG: 4Fe-4S dicluster domain-containing protein [Dehalococcoidia bacterium]
MDKKDKTNIQKLAELSGMADSKSFYRILEHAITDEEAEFVLALPDSFDNLAAKFGMNKKDVEEKILGLARRGLLSRNPDKLSPEKFQFTNIAAILHDNILSSDPQYIPSGMPGLWMDLYRGDRWWKEIGEFYGFFEEPILRVVPAEKSLGKDQSLMSCERITEIIEANRDLITIRNCCCRVGAEICYHPRNVCMQFKGRAEFDLYRGSGRKVSPDEAVSIALQAIGAGLVPTVTNISVTDNLEFICFCCSCACMVLDPGLKTGSLPKILSPSRFEAEINVEACNGCKHCVIRCQFGAIDMKPVPGHDTIKAVLDREKCYGCGVCELACVPGAIRMVEERPGDFIPEGVKDEEILHF